MDNLKIWNVEKGPNFVNCPNFVTIFVEFWKFKYFFFISLAIPCPSPFGIHWTINFTIKIIVSVYFQQQISASLNRDVHPGDSWPYVPGLILSSSPYLRPALGWWPLPKCVILCGWLNQTLNIQHKFNGLENIDTATSCCTHRFFYPW